MMKFRTSDKYLAGSLLCFEGFMLSEYSNNEFVIDCEDKFKLVILLEQHLENDLCVDFELLKENISKLEEYLY